MKTKLILTLLFLAMLNVPQQLAGQTTAFGYQGYLNNAGVPANGLFDFIFTLFESEAGPIVVSGPLTQDAVSVDKGMFNVTLDFGPGIFTGPERWLEISVRPNGGGDSTVLSPRLALRPTPYALHAYSAGSVIDGAVGSSALADGAVTTLKLSPGSVGATHLSPVLPPVPGQVLSFDGIDLAWTTLTGSSGGPSLWQLTDGNKIYYNAGNVGIGTTTPDSKLTVRTTGSFNRYGFEHTDGAIRLCSYLDPGFGAWLGTRSNHPLNFFVNDGTPSVTVGTGGATTFTPNGGYGSMTCGTPNGESGFTIKGANRADVRFDGVTLKLVAAPNAGPPSSLNGIAVHTSGNVGIGTINPQTKLHIENAGGGAEAMIKAGNERAILSLDSTLGGQNRVWTLESGLFGSPGLFGIYDRNAGRARLTIDTSGVVGVDVLQIRGGADLSEQFDIRSAEAATATKIEPGMVACIDPENAGKLIVSSQPYDRRVAGIVSGAGGVKPGMLMSQTGSIADGSLPVALTGRVYCYVDASQGAVEPGDLLTTSDTPGHAMKVTDQGKAQGAILGKAMGALKEGRGLVLVLVTLQ